MQGLEKINAEVLHATLFRSTLQVSLPGFEVRYVLCSLSKMEELKASHEAMKQELESYHNEQLQCVKKQYEMSLEGEWTLCNRKHSLNLPFKSICNCLVHPSVAECMCDSNVYRYCQFGEIFLMP